MMKLNALKEQRSPGIRFGHEMNDKLTKKSNFAISDQSINSITDNSLSKKLFYLKKGR